MVHYASALTPRPAGTHRSGNTKGRVQARFAFDGIDYWLWVTDPIVERRYLAGTDGEYAVGEAYLTISIGESYQDYCYKLVATVIGRT